MAGTWTDEELAEAIAPSGSWKEVCRRLGARYHGTTTTALRKQADAAGIDYSTFRNRGLPPQTPDPALAPRPTNVLIAPARPARTRRVVALMAAHQYGWFTYVGVDEPSQIYEVVLSDGRRRYLEGPEVLPWLLGWADAAGPDYVARIAYRDGLI